MVLKVALGVFVWILLARFVIKWKDELLGDKKSREYVKDTMKWGCYTLLYIIAAIWFFGGIGLFLYGGYSENEFLSELALYVFFPSLALIGILYFVMEISDSKEKKKSKKSGE